MITDGILVEAWTSPALTRPAPLDQNRWALRTGGAGRVHFIGDLETHGIWKPETDLSGKRTAGIHGLHGVVLFAWNM